MIFYLTPPKVIVDLRNFNQCCISRLKYHVGFADSKGDHPAAAAEDNLIESLIPGTKLDKAGHFVLRCFCLNRPDVSGYILEKETELFLRRLNGHSAKEIRKCCERTLREVAVQSKWFAESDVVTLCKAKLYYGPMVLSALNDILSKLSDKHYCEHFKNANECSETCRRYSVQIPFQVCSSMVRSRQLEMRDGSATVPCSKWSKLLEELFAHHFTIGLKMISHSVLRTIDGDVRWKSAFRTLYELYAYHRCRPTPLQRRVRISYRHVDVEKRHFPPCMSHLLNVLRENHRLAHTWRYHFSLFLKDIGLTLQDSMEFWKSEYSQSCSTGASCTHSWQQNERKYRYSIRHLYGLEGAKIERKSKSCRRIQTMQIGMREEGGCPFVHMDDSTSISTLCDAVKQNKSAVDRIIELKNSGKPCEACALHMTFSSGSGFARDGDGDGDDHHSTTTKTDENVVYFESPSTYYFCKKNIANKSLDW